MVASNVALAVLVVVGSFACGSDSKRSGDDGLEGSRATATAGPDDRALYDGAHRVEVDIELDAADWQALRLDGLSAIDWVSRDDFSHEYAEFAGSATIDGERYASATLRKKGFIGSVTALRPSLRLDLAGQAPPTGSAANGAADDADWAGVRRMTLNNDRQDPSHTHQCMAYGRFAAAGMPAPRCNLAHVVVNGEDLGIYSNVEPIKKALLRRFFDDAEGNLYEGQLSDFDAESSRGLELDTHRAANDRTDVGRLITALEQSDAALVSSLSEIIDLDAFRDFWAMETLLGHWDGYSGNANNFYAYHDPTRDRFVFLPWGTDQAFSNDVPSSPENAGLVVYAEGLISRRLYALPEERARYRERLGELVEGLWKPIELLAEIDRFAELAPEIPTEELDVQRETVRTRGSLIQAALARPAPEWIVREPEPPRPTDACTGLTSEVTGSFETVWQPEFEGEPGHATLDITLDGMHLDIETNSVAGPNPANGGATVQVSIASTLDDSRTLFVSLDLPFEEFKPGEFPLHALETVGFVGVLDPSVDDTPLLGAISDGSIQFERATPEPGAAVVGQFHGRLYQLACLTQTEVP